MTTPRRRRTPQPPALQLVERTSHFRLIGGRTYRDCWVRVDGEQLRLYALPVAS